MCLHLKKKKSCQVDDSQELALTPGPSLTPYGFGVDGLHEVEGKQQKDCHQKDNAHQCQKHIAADEHRVNNLQEKDESDEEIFTNENHQRFHSWPPGVRRGPHNGLLQFQCDNYKLKQEYCTNLINNKCINIFTLLIIMSCLL